MVPRRHPTYVVEAAPRMPLCANRIGAQMRPLTLILAGGFSVASIACSDRTEWVEAAGVEVLLTPQVPQPEGDRRLLWSPKGEKLWLDSVDGALETSLGLGPRGTPPSRIRLSRSENQSHFDLLSIDRDRDGRFDDAERLETTPTEIRRKFWSSFETVVDVPVVDPESGSDDVNPYALSFWYVEDPTARSDELVLRFTRRGWMEGHVTLDSVEAVVLLTEDAMDGVFDRSDSWALASRDSASDVFKLEYARPAKRHAWLFDAAYVIGDIDPSGRRLVLVPFDPGISRLEEAEMDDEVAVDRRAPHSGRAVAFRRDFQTAEASARAEGKPLFVDFETVWCGPCKVMDEWVYTADAVVNASLAVVPVKVDGDEHPELVARFGVEGYPTMVIVSPEGQVLRRASGYVGVEEMSGFLAGNR